MQIIETRAVSLQAPQDLKLSAGFTLPRGLYQGTEERIRTDSIAGPSWAIKYKIALPEERLDVTEFVRQGRLIRGPAKINVGTAEKAHRRVDEHVRAAAVGKVRRPGQCATNQKRAAALWGPQPAKVCPPTDIRGTGERTMPVVSHQTLIRCSCSKKIRAPGGLLFGHLSAECF